jgi:thiamine-monophosphate kinase
MLNLLTTDMLVEGVHFDLMYTPYRHLGYKAAVVNFSDIYAMNGTPLQMLVSIAVSSKISVEALEEFYEGLKHACKIYNVDLVGGDTTSSLSGMIISITLIGEVNKEKIVYRNGAKENDLICVSGDLGAAYLGLQVLEREKKIFKENPAIQPDLSGFDYVLERQLKPEARKDIISWLNENAILPTSMIDISDGLSSELLHICQQSEKGCQVYEEKIPIDVSSDTAANEFNLHAITCALNGGEDYELLFTVSIKDFEKIKSNSAISVIGHITDKNSGCCLVSKAGEFLNITAQGWNSFK